MALFEGEEMVPVTTPDGRTISAPRSLAGMAPQQISAPAPVSVPGAPPMPPQELPQPTLPPPTDAGVAPTGPGIVEEGEPDVTPVLDMSPEVVTANPKRMVKARNAQAAYEASPEGKLAAAKKTQDQAVADQANAITAMSAVEGATNDLLHGALVERNVDLVKAENARLTEMQAREREKQAKLDEIVGYRKKIENTKIDRNLDHPVMTGIFAALAGLGSAMKGEKVDVYGLLNSIIDRKVAAQEADLDKMGKVYGMKKDELEMLKEKSKNRLEFHNAMIAAETNKAIRTIEEITARSASEKTRANGKMMIAELQARAADKTMEAARWGIEYAQRDKAEANQQNRFYADLGFRKSQQADSMRIRREEIAKDMAIALANTKATRGDAEYKAHLELAKEARQFGVRDGAGDLYLTPEGKAQAAQAEELEKQAAAMEANPDVMARSIASDKIKMLREKAAMIRDDITTGAYAIKAHNETEATAISDSLASSQTTVELIDRIRSIQSRRAVLKRGEAEAELQSLFAQMTPNLKEAWKLGALDKGVDKLVGGIIGADPSSAWNAELLGSIVAHKMYEDGDNYKVRLNSVVDNLENAARNRLVRVGAKFKAGETALQRMPEPPPISESTRKLSGTQTQTERVDAAEARVDSGFLAKGLYDLGHHVRKVTTLGRSAATPEEAARREAENGSLTYPGLAKEQEAPFEDRLQALTSGTPAQQKQAADELVSLVADVQDNPAKAIPILHNLREHAPKTVYQAARGVLTPGGEVDKQMAYEENQRIGTAAQYEASPEMFAAGVIRSIKDTGEIGDIAGAAEIARQAGQGDPRAKKAWAEIVKQVGYNKTLPRGSTFRGGR